MSEQAQTVAYLGPEASFSHVAASEFFTKETLLPHQTIPDCIEAVANGKVDYAIVPLENALEGSVPLTIDYLFHGDELFIGAEVLLPIEQHLLIHEQNKDKVKDVTAIMSHPHALAQCHKFFQYHYHGTPLVPRTSTAEAARYVAEHPEENIAAIANRFAVKKYDLHLAEERVHDFHFNHTRFVVLSKENMTFDKLGRRETPKTMLMIRLPEDDESGMLHRILSVFAWRRLNLSKIESRPLKTGLGDYFFIADVLEDETHPMMKGALEELAALGCVVRSFGTYYVYDYS
ncbi:prephenate dehydratase [Planococcaceae bacterium Storch 2/2-2]|nr:prephenate dehydratase [Planococcaceae bacterium Storch 2/2-2]